MHTTYEIVLNAPAISSKKYYVSLSAMLNLLHSSANQELLENNEKHLCNSRILKERVGAVHPSYINYCLKVEYPLHFVVGYFQPVTQQYESKTVRKAPLQSKQPLLKIWMISIMKGSHHVLLPNQHFSLSTMMNGMQRRTLVSP